MALDLLSALMNSTVVSLMMEEEKQKPKPLPRNDYDDYGYWSDEV